MDSQKAEKKPLWAEKSINQHHTAGEKFAVCYKYEHLIGLTEEWEVSKWTRKLYDDDNLNSTEVSAEKFSRTTFEIGREKVENEKKVRSYPTPTAAERKSKLSGAIGCDAVGRRSSKFISHFYIFIGWMVNAMTQTPPRRTRKSLSFSSFSLSALRVMWKKSNSTENCEKTSCLLLGLLLRVCKTLQRCSMNREKWGEIVKILQHDWEEKSIAYMDIECVWVRSNCASSQFSSSPSLSSPLTGAAHDTRCGRRVTCGSVASKVINFLHHRRQRGEEKWWKKRRLGRKILIYLGETHSGLSMQCACFW